MQSILQYRRFGRHVQRQYKRDYSKAQALGGSNRDSSSSSPSPCTSPPSSPTAAGAPIEGYDHLDLRDPEKAEQAANGPRRSDTGDQRAEAGMGKLTTIKTMGTALGITLTGVEVRPRTVKEGGADESVFVVGFEGERDIMNPHNWSFLTRIGATVNIALIGWIVGFASSVDSAALTQAAADFGVSEVTESLATGLFLIGFGVGALFAGPISETVGRNPVYIATLTLYMVFILASALAPNIGAQLVFRFMAGCFASTPLTCAGGSISDLWNPMERVYAFPLFANAAFLGPLFGPVVGGFIGESHLLNNWRWTEWVTLIISGFILILLVLFQPETYAPILLAWKAKKLRQLTGDTRYRAEIEIRDVAFVNRLKHALYRPFVLTCSEPIIILIALYLTVIYVILFTFLEGYKFIFSDTYGFSEGMTGLSFLGIGIGLCFATLIVPLIYVWAKRDLAKIKEQGGTRLPPEFRLWFSMFGAPAIPISMFWMGWTAYPTISFWSPLAASVLFGYGILCVFISSYQYIIDSYESYSASALVSITFIRYVAAGGMIEVAIPFYQNLGVHWTLTILGCLSALLVPVPYLFYLFGPQIRAKSKYATA
ncbi:MAG: hypothetical protein Q9163_004400 [Psora crenata]